MADIRVTFTYSHPFFGPLTVTANVDPGRPAPPCSNSSAPAFSDSGEGPSAELLCVMWGPHNITDSVYDLAQELIDQAVDTATEQSCQERD